MSLSHTPLSATSNGTHGSSLTHHSRIHPVELTAVGLCPSLTCHSATSSGTHCSESISLTQTPLSATSSGTKGSESIFLTHHSQLCPVEPKAVSLSLTHTPFFGYVYYCYGSSITHTPLSATSSGTHGSGSMSLTHTPLSAASSGTHGSRSVSLTQMPLSATSSGTEGNESISHTTLDYVHWN